MNTHPAPNARRLASQVRRAAPILAFILVLCSRISSAAPGDLDPDFGLKGIVRLGFTQGDSQGKGAVTQADGRIVVAGSIQEGEYHALAVLRYNADGSPDINFGTGGRATILSGQGADYFGTAVALQNDGKIVVCGYNEAFDRFSLNRYIIGMVLARFDPDGTLDASFGTNGVVIPELPEMGEQANALVIQSDGRIVAGGAAVSGGMMNFAALRYSTNGVLDASFGSAGVSVVSFGSYATARGLLIQPDGKLVMVGSAGGDFALARLQTNGVLDTTFGGTGKVLTSFGSLSDSAEGLAIQFGNVSVSTPDRLVVAGWTYTNSNSYLFAVARYNLDGTLDTSFDGDGKVTTAISGDSRALAVKVTGILNQARKIHVAGFAPGAFSLVRYHANGSLDTTLDGDGIVTTPLGSSAEGAALTLSGAYYLLAGSAVTNGVRGIALVRYQVNGALDTTLDGDGQRIELHGFGNEARASSVAIQPDGRILVLGSHDVIGFRISPNFAYLRLGPNGMLDDTFSSDGKVYSLATLDTQGYAVVAQGNGNSVTVADLGPGVFGFTSWNSNGIAEASGSVTIGTFGSATAVATQTDGKVVVAGAALMAGNDYDFGLARFHSNGVPDLMFDGDGKTSLSLGTATDFPSALLILPEDGRIVVAGKAGQALALLRLNPDGSPDVSLDFDGRITLPLPVTGAEVTDLVLADGKYLVGGFSGGAGRRGFLLRLHPNGNLDSGFGVGGIVTNGVSGCDAIALQADGRILITGTTNQDFLVQRFFPNGGLDASYGVGGTAVIDAGHSVDFARDLAVDGMGRAVVVGSAGGLFGVVRLLGDPPSLFISRAPPGVMIEWNSAGHTLQSNSVADSAGWIDLPATAATNRFSLPGAAGAGFFRIKP